ncbi:glycosyltransferase family 4 protein [Dysgonomonas sp. HGC4]|uniref:glycosyltransferase family 4 protein n=1 Tax=Dysgonomonas sp. HGC4 TaxID=1658009 RepID=UPI0006820AA8|nr:glycosyltransferase family 4 protein [Dysgonomonas sp. HGC4]MBD8347000.1 glycosyltransferase family 4 protein [Dysgonomonas sp. HGC4]
MKIAYVVHAYTNSAGMERVLAKKSNYLVAQGFEVFIITLGEDNAEPFFYFDPKIKIYKLGIPNDTEEYKELYLKKLSACLALIKPDISISTGLGITKYLYEVNDGSKKVLELHFTKYKRKFELAALDKYCVGRFITNIYSYKRTKVARMYDRFVVLTEEDKDSWQNLSNISVIPNPISFIPEDYSSNESKRVIAIGRYTYQKGFDLLISIWAQIHKQHPDWILSIYGSGKKKAKLERQIQQLELEKCIELNTPTKEIALKLVESSIFAMTSRYEGQGLALMEAMACGLPAVAFACKCGPRDIIRNGEDGFIVDTKDYKAFEEKLASLMKDSDLRTKMGKQARQNVLRFSEENIMPKWTKLFNDLLNE